MESSVFCGKSFCYVGNNKLLVGGKGSIHIINVKDIKLEYIIEIGSSEVSCFLKFKNIIICGYGDTTHCSSWSSGKAQEKTTKFLIIKPNKDSFEHFFLKDVPPIINLPKLSSSESI